MSRFFLSIEKKSLFWILHGNRQRDLDFGIWTFVAISDYCCHLGDHYLGNIECDRIMFVLYSYLIVGCRHRSFIHSTVNTAEPAKVRLLTLSPLSSCFFPPFFLQFGDISKNSFLKLHVLCMYLFTSGRVGCLFVVIGSPIGDFTV